MSTPERRLGIFSQRDIREDISRCSGYEFEDVVAEIEKADIYAPRLSSVDHWRHRMRRYLSQRSGLFEHVPSGASCRPLDGRYELFGCFVQKPVELLTLDSLGNWRARADMAFCVLEEVWQGTIDQYEPLLRTLSQFDLLACAFIDSCDRLAELTGRPVIHLPGAADILRFHPTGAGADRPIDVYYMGRRRPELHQALLRHARKTGAFYLYDTATRPPITADHVAHRELFASLVQRSKLFVVDYAKIGHTEQKGGQLLWGPRHVEGMAGGAVQIGYAPDSPDYTENFDWPEAVTCVSEFADTAIEQIAELLADTARQDAIRRANFARVGARHDWLDRWRRITEHFGLPETPGMQDRASRIEKAAMRLTDAPKTAA